MPPNFSRPSSEPSFLQSQSELPSDEAKFLKVLTGTKGGKQTTRSMEARTTLFLSAALQKKVRMRAMDQDKTITEYFLELLRKDGLT